MEQYPETVSKHREWLLVSQQVMVCEQVVSNFNTTSRFNLACVAASKSEPNLVKASNSRYEASRYEVYQQPLHGFDLCRTTYTWIQMNPHRWLDEYHWKRPSARKICPSVIEITLVAI